MIHNAKRIKFSKYKSKVIKIYFNIYKTNALYDYLDLFLN